MRAYNFGRDGCTVGKREVTYRKLALKYRCGRCGGCLVLQWTEPSDDHPTGWWMACGRGCQPPDFAHEGAVARSRSEAIEVLDGLPPELVAQLK